MRASLKPLTPEEANLAKDNHYLVERFLSAKRLSAEDWYDVVIFRYLLTVERWFREPSLYRYSFSTVAWRSMGSAVINESRKMSRRIKTISLDEPIPGTGDITYYDAITYDNLNYIAYKEVY